MINCIFSDVSERDMDLLISEEIVSSFDFLYNIQMDNELHKLHYWAYIVKN